MSELKQNIEVPEVLSNYSREHKERRRRQMMYFYGATAVTLLSARLAYRGVQARKYIPQLFNANHIPPQFSFQRDAIFAVTHASLLATSSFAMALTGVWWCWDISNIKEFGYKIKRSMGGDSNEKKLSEVPLDEESAAVQDAINKFLNGEGLDEAEEALE